MCKVVLLRVWGWHIRANGHLSQRLNQRGDTQKIRQGLIRGLRSHVMVVHGHHQTNIPDDFRDIARVLLPYGEPSIRFALTIAGARRHCKHADGLLMNSGPSGRGPLGRVFGTFPEAAKGFDDTAQKKGVVGVDGANCVQVGGMSHEPRVRCMGRLTSVALVLKVPDKIYTHPCPSRYRSYCASGEDRYF